MPSFLIMGGAAASETLKGGYICTIGGAVPPENSLERTLTALSAVPWYLVCVLVCTYIHTCVWSNISCCTAPVCVCVRACVHGQTLKMKENENYVMLIVLNCYYSHKFLTLCKYSFMCIPASSLSTLINLNSGILFCWILLLGHSYSLESSTLFLSATCTTASTPNLFLMPSV